MIETIIYLFRTYRPHLVIHKSGRSRLCLLDGIYLYEMALAHMFMGWDLYDIVLLPRHIIAENVGSRSPTASS